MPPLTLLLLWWSAGARADPFYVYGPRTPAGTLGLNAYTGFGQEEPTWSSLYLFSGLAPGLDLILGGTGVFEAQQFVPSTLEVMPRAFLSGELELALAGHLFVGAEGSVELGPEIHISGNPTDTLGLWVNTGARYVLEPGAEPQSFAWLGAEVCDGVPFFAVELDLGASGPTTASATLIPSVGVWLGPQGDTGLSAGWLMSLDGGPLGAGLWLWQALDLRSSQSRPR